MKSLLLFFLLFILISSEASSQKFRPDLFCFEDAFLLTPLSSFDSRVRLLKDLGFDGFEMEGLDSCYSKLAALDRAGLKLYMVYIEVDLDKANAYDPRLKDFIAKLSGRHTTLWLHVHNDALSPSDTTGDARCVAVLRELADFSSMYGVSIALYPHSRFWLEKVGDSVRLTKKIGRSNVGAVFNLCHFLKTDERSALEIRLKESIPYLAAVSVNGADDGNTRDMDWSRLIQPLGTGNFDVLNILRVLKNNNFKGPVGLQCYNIEGDPAVFLKKSMKAWQDYIGIL
jgi:sugar phosphate isomerase/epimerase